MIELFSQAAPYVLLVAVLAAAILVATHDEHRGERKSQHD
jgi:hypothetical protein